jgi:hypothetical protein
MDDVKGFLLGDLSTANDVTGFQCHGTPPLRPPLRFNWGSRGAAIAGQPVFPRHHDSSYSRGGLAFPDLQGIVRSLLRGSKPDAYRAVHRQSLKCFLIRTSKIRLLKARNMSVSATTRAESHTAHRTKPRQTICTILLIFYYH